MLFNSKNFDGNLYQYVNNIAFTDIVAAIAAGVMIFGGVVPYIPQYIDIRRTQNADGFSTYVCLNLLVANTLRILFWFGKYFEIPLLLQSIIMNFTMLAMIHICMKAKKKSEIVPAPSHLFTGTSYESDHRLSDFDPRYFWKWTDFTSYLEFLCLFTLGLSTLTYLLIDVSVFVEFVGFLALMFEACLGAPQFYKNFQKKSTKGMSVKMVLMWTSGDVFKTGYFILRSSPIQFWMCGSLQVCLDMAILCQVYHYRNMPEKPSIQ